MDDARARPSLAAPPTLADTPFAELLLRDPEFAELRAEHAKLPPRERHNAADWAYHSGAAAQMFEAATGRQLSEDEACRSYAASLAIDPEYVPAMMTMAMLAYDYGRREEAMTSLLELADLPADADEDLAAIIDEAGDALIDRSDLERAERLYAAAAHAHPDVALFHVGLCYCAGKDGRHSEAVEHGRRAVDLDPSKHTHWSDLGYSLLEAGRYEEAEGILLRAVALDTADEGFARANLAHLRELQGEGGERSALSPSRDDTAR